MKVLCTLILSIIIFAQSTFADDIQTEFILNDNTQTIKEGDLIEATMRVWPLENADLSQFKKLEKTVFFNSLYLAQITSLELSQNNADVIELKGLFIVKSAQVQPSYSFKYNTTDIVLNSGVLSVKALKDTNGDFYVLTQSLNSSKLWMVGVAFLLLFLALLFVERDKIKNIFKPNLIQRNKKKYDALFKVADKREDFEHLYNEKKHWIDLLAETTPAHQEFLKILNQHQYKKNWGNEELLEVRAAFDVIRRSFEK